MSMGTCGGRLHGTCGNVVGDNEMHRICSKCLDKNGKRQKDSPDSEVEGEEDEENDEEDDDSTCLLYTSPSPRDKRQSRMPSSA